MTPKNLFDGVYKNRKVLVTGHTGFKGSWLTLWLKQLGAEVTGYSAYLPSKPCNFEVMRLEKQINHVQGDVLDIRRLGETFKKNKPQMVFHLAAQPIVRKSYDDPKRTFDTNVGGTVNVLECIRRSPSVKAAVIITSDKCYRNVEWTWGYRENDALGGDDPYSASKACAEIVVNSYVKSFFSDDGARAKVATARAGNVVGGGDWAADRIVPDCVRSWAAGRSAVIRNPSSTRPWQHVLEPLSGYLLLGAALYSSGALNGEAFNFGPEQKTNESVAKLIGAMSSCWSEARWERYKGKNSGKKESSLLKLSCDKALNLLHWRSALPFDETVALTAEWYKKYYAGRGRADMGRYAVGQIESYIEKAVERGIPWAAGRAK